MRTALRKQAYVCLDCKLRQPWSHSRRYQSNLAETQPVAQPVDLSASPPPPEYDIPSEQFVPSTPLFKPRPVVSQGGKKSRSKNAASAAAASNKSVQKPPSSEKLEENNEEEVTGEERKRLQTLSRLRDLLKTGVVVAVSQNKTVTGISFEDAVKAADLEDQACREMLKSLEITYKGRPASLVLTDIVHAKGPPNLQRKLLRRLAFGKDGRTPSSAMATKANSAGGRRRGLIARSKFARTDRPDPSPRRSLEKAPGPSGQPPHLYKHIAPVVESSRPRRVLAKASSFSRESPKGSGPIATTEEPSPSRESPRVIPRLDEANIRTISDDDLQMKPLTMETPSVPGLSFDLARVLFNPGVYQLQDPRSRVFNFSPYLQRILPVSEFNFDVLNEYITSSRDKGLIDLGRKYEKKYLGSSSSMTGALVHFHFLLSNWRLVNVNTLSQSFRDPLRSFTQFQRGPSAIFLRWKDGLYAVDADKEHDSANILMSLGKSMEKLLTLPEEEYEKYRKTAQREGAEPPRPEPEVYHYTESGDFLLRSQLDAHDARLPGTGMFDLKTRAVVSIRMNVRDHEQGLGYEIHKRFGDMESYEREYFDMIRSAFLKYSLQVRMGRMDGIFVAYHNIERIFGFQYVSLPEMDLHLHGTEDPTIGDAEFKLSLRLLNEVFNRATEAMPETSIRFHFETRDSKGVEGSFMYIFAEAQSETDVENIQNSKQAEIAEFEARILNTPQSADDEEDEEAVSEDTDIDSDNDAAAVDEKLNSAEIKARAAAKSEVFSQPPEGQLVGYVLRTRSKINGRLKVRPEQLNEADSWDLEYTLEELPHERALNFYTQCRARRAKLQLGTQREDAAADYYLRKMKQLAQQGKHLRKSMDMADAGRPLVVLDSTQ